MTTFTWSLLSLMIFVLMWAFIVYKNALKLSEVLRMKNEPVEETEDEEPGGLWDEKI